MKYYIDADKLQDLRTKLYQAYDAGDMEKVLRLSSLIDQRQLKVLQNSIKRICSA